VILLHQTGDARIYPDYADPVHQIEEYLEITGLEKADIGLVIGPRIDAKEDTVNLEINLRVLDDEDAMYSVDGVYATEKDWIEYLDEVYPVLLDRFKEEFSESELLYFEPDL